MLPKLVSGLGTVAACLWSTLCLAGRVKDLDYGPTSHTLISERPPSVICAGDRAKSVDCAHDIFYNIACSELATKYLIKYFLSFVENFSL